MSFILEIQWIVSALLYSMICNNTAYGFILLRFLLYRNITQESTHKVKAVPVDHMLGAPLP